MEYAVFRNNVKVYPPGNIKDKDHAIVLLKHCRNRDPDDVFDLRMIEEIETRLVM